STSRPLPYTTLFRSSRLHRNTEFGTDTFVFFPGTKNIHIQAGDTVYFAYLGKSPLGNDETYIFARGISKGYDQSQSLSKQLPQRSEEHTSELQSRFE